MKTIVNALFALVVAVVLTIASSSRADSLSGVGFLTAIRLVQSSSDDAATFSGQVTHSLAGDIYWGGSWCSNYTGQPSVLDVQIMNDAMMAGKQVAIQYKLQGSRKCWTGQVTYD